MPSRFWMRQASSPSQRAGARWRRWLPARPYALASVAVAMLVAVFAGVQLGNSAISDINPIHYRGAVVHPRDRGAAVPEHQARARPPAYAALYGWDEGQAAIAAERAREVIEVPPAAPPTRRQVAAVRTWAETPPPQDFRVTIHSGKDGIDRTSYRGRDYRSRDVYLPRPGDRDDDMGASDEEGEPEVSD